MEIFAHPIGRTMCAGSHSVTEFSAHLFSDFLSPHPNPGFHDGQIEYSRQLDFSYENRRRALVTSSFQVLSPADRLIKLCALPNKGPASDLRV